MRKISCSTIHTCFSCPGNAECDRASLLPLLRAQKRAAEERLSITCNAELAQVYPSCHLCSPPWAVFSWWGLVILRNLKAIFQQKSEAIQKSLLAVFYWHDWQRYHKRVASITCDWVKVQIVLRKLFWLYMCRGTLLLFYLNRNGVLVQQNGLPEMLYSLG